MIKYILTLLGIITITIGSYSVADNDGLAPIGGSRGLINIFNTETSNIILPPSEKAMFEGTHAGIQGESHLITNISETQTKITSQETATQKTIEMIQRLINWALALVAVIALVILIFGGIQMITAAGDDGKFKSGMKIIKKISIGIAGLMVSWLIISLIFRIIEITTT